MLARTVSAAGQGTLSVRKVRTLARGEALVRQQLMGLGTPVSFALAMASCALISALGSLGTALVIVFFVILGTPASRVRRRLS